LIFIGGQALSLLQFKTFSSGGRQMKFTFKKTPREGPYRTFQKRHTTIKLQKKQVGYIRETDDAYKLHFAIKKQPTSVSPAPFKWITIARQFESEGAAREYVKKREQAILQDLDLYCLEGD
jgi:hypothetical protein